MQLSRIDFIRNVKHRARVSIHGYAGQQYKEMLDMRGTDYYLEKRIEKWYVVFDFAIAVETGSEVWTVEEILAREG